MKRPPVRKSVKPTNRIGTPYPYTIPPVKCPDPTIVKDLNPWNIVEFFRVEALLRSKTVMDLYNATFRAWDRKNNESDLFSKKYHVLEGWNALEGEHHDYLDPSYSRVRVKHLYVPDFYVGRGIVDLSGMMEVDPESAKYYANLILDRSEDGPRAILFAIDPARPPEATIKELRPYLAKLHKPYKNKKRLDDYFLNRKCGPHLSASGPSQLSLRLPITEGTITESVRIRIPRDRIIIGVHKPGESPPFQTYKSPLIKDYEGIKTWLNYLRCYDLRTMTELSFGKIAQQVYGEGTRKPYERAEQGYKRVRQLIRAAEQNDWPPSIR